MPVMHWEVFFMKTDFEISQRKKYTDIQELDRKIEEERQRLEALNRIEEDGLHVPITRVLDDHRL
jgi:tRNA A-37 threonylcarbamoyl transferase component Bud32